MNNTVKSKLVVALDVDAFDEARHIVDQLRDVVEVFKIGSQLFTACGPVIVRYVLAQGREVFLDLKYHDIPNTVANAVRSAVNLGVPVNDALIEQNSNIKTTKNLLMCTLHTSGGREMLEMAVEAASKQSQTIGVARILLLGITVLTSNQKTDNIRDLVMDRAKLAKEAGLDGVVASSQEARMIRDAFGKDFIIVTPGIRPSGSDCNDQKRIATPSDAVLAGSNYLVVGRPIVKADAPLVAAKSILEEIKQTSLS